MAETNTPLPPPPLPPHIEPGQLRDLDAASLETEAARLAGAERATRAAMAPYDRQLGEIRARREEIATERRRRERAERHAARVSVRELAGSAEMPSLDAALQAEPSPLPEDRPLAAVRAYLASGGEVGFGYPAVRASSASPTAGRSAAPATWGEAREPLRERMGARRTR